MATILYGDFEWEEVKAASNLLDHKVTFEEAADALATDPYEHAEENRRNGETRVESLCMSYKTRVLFVVTTEAESDRTRIISARKAEPHEQRKYEENRYAHDRR